jgi:hypothetical protein
MSSVFLWLKPLRAHGEDRVGRASLFERAHVPAEAIPVKKKENQRKR